MRSQRRSTSASGWRPTADARRDKARRIARELDCSVQTALRLIVFGPDALRNEDLRKRGAAALAEFGVEPLNLDPKTHDLSGASIRGRKG